MSKKNFTMENGEPLQELIDAIDNGKETASGFRSIIKDDEAIEYKIKIIDSEKIRAIAEEV